MSIRYYAVAPELDGAGDGTLKTARYELLMVALDKVCGKRKWARTEFGVVGRSEAGVEAFAVYAAEEISKMSQGVPSKLMKILGHYRNDEIPEVVPSNLRINGSFIVSNGCDPDNMKKLSQKVNVPWPADDVTRADLKTLGETQLVDGAGFSGFGKVGWTTDEKTALSAYYTDEAVGASIKEYEKIDPFIAVSADDGPGVDASDPVLGEAA